MNPAELLHEPETVEVDAHEFKIAKNGEQLTSTDLYMCVCVALYDSRTKTGAMIHIMSLDNSLPAKFQKFIHETGGGITDIVITGGAHSENNEDEEDKEIEKRLEYVRQVTSNFRQQATLHDHQSPLNTKAALTLDTKTGIFEISFSDDEMSRKERPPIAERRLTINNGQEIWKANE